MKQIAYIAFQGGGALGMAHLGAWREVARQYQIEGAAGTSAGAIVATLCAAEYQPPHAIDVFRNLQWPKYVNRLRMLLTLLNVRRNDDPFRRWLDKKLAEHPSIKERRVTFASLYQRTKIYLAVVACDLNDDRSEPVIFDKDTEPDISVAVAVRASISIPGVFMPVPNLFKGQELVDGGLLLNFPVAILHSKTQEKNCPLIGVRFDRPRVSKSACGP